jgi:hypothetical protein
MMDLDICESLKDSKAEEISGSLEALNLEEEHDQR